ncbi:MAG: hypothetical protein K2M02_01520, partial [Duncaniella sp.]|nr:hypothetical protein [Duncaniella sp.]
YFQTPIPTQYPPQNVGLSTKHLDAIIEFCSTLLFFKIFFFLNRGFQEFLHLRGKNITFQQ